MLDTLTVEHWRPQLNKTFQALAGDGVELCFELIEVDALPEKPNAKRQPYSLIFRGPADPVLAQGMVELQQENMATLALFLVPVGPDKQGMCYEAVFT